MVMIEIGDFVEYEMLIDVVFYMFTYNFFIVMVYTVSFAFSLQPPCSLTYYFDWSLQLLQTFINDASHLII